MGSGGAPAPTADSPARRPSAPAGPGWPPRPGRWACAPLPGRRGAAAWRRVARKKGKAGFASWTWKSKKRGCAVRGGLSLRGGVGRSLSGAPPARRSRESGARSSPAAGQGRRARCPHADGPGMTARASRLSSALGDCARSRASFLPRLPFPDAALGLSSDPGALLGLHPVSLDNLGDLTAGNWHRLGGGYQLPPHKASQVWGGLCPRTA